MKMFVVKLVKLSEIEQSRHPINDVIILLIFDRASGQVDDALINNDQS